MSSPANFSSLLTIFSSRSEQPQLPVSCWPAPSKCRTFSQRGPHPGSPLRPAALCCPLPLPPVGHTARLRRPTQAQLQRAGDGVARPLRCGGGALRPGGGRRLAVGSVAACSAFTLRTASGRQHQHPRTSSKNWRQ